MRFCNPQHHGAQPSPALVRGVSEKRLNYLTFGLCTCYDGNIIILFDAPVLELQVMDGHARNEEWPVAE